MAKTASAKKMDQTFRFKAPNAVSVQLVGDFTHWKGRPINLKRDKMGVWKTKVNLAPGTYHYRFLVDGEWRDDPECTLRIPNPYGSENSVLQVV